MTFLDLIGKVITFLLTWSLILLMGLFIFIGDNFQQLLMGLIIILSAHWLYRTIQIVRREMRKERRRELLAQRSGRTRVSE